jgi:hypothetical protein
LYTDGQIGQRRAGLPCGGRTSQAGSLAGDDDLLLRGAISRTHCSGDWIEPASPVRAANVPCSRETSIWADVVRSQVSMSEATPAQFSAPSDASFVTHEIKTVYMR